MTIRTLIEVEGKDKWDFEQKLSAALDKLGYQPKDEPSEIAYRRDMFAALHEKGIDPHKLVEELRDRLAKERLEMRDHD